MAIGLKVFLVLLWPVRRRGRSLALLAFLVMLSFCRVCVPHTVSRPGDRAWWKATRRLRDGSSQPVLFEFRQVDRRLMGTVRFDWGDLPIHDGREEGDQISFQAGATFQFSGARTATGFELLFTGSHEPDQILLLSRADQRDLRIPADRPLLPAIHAVKAPLDFARRPPMGWNSWNYFHQNVSDVIIRQVADAIASNGMREAGYSYIVIDDGWQGQRDANGRLHPNERFPDMKGLADYVHAKGLKLGIYSSPGPQTCGKHEGSYRHEAEDARTFADWGVDSLKYDWCTASRVYLPSESQAVFQKMGAALQATGREILYSLCQYGMEDVWLWGPDVGASTWRTTADIHADFGTMHQNALTQQMAAPFSGPGHWNDPDMLEVGNGGMNDLENRSHMNLWAMLAAPLFAGNDVRTMTETTRGILLNRKLIAIDQDGLGRQAVLKRKLGAFEIWERPLENGDRAMLLLNVAEMPESHEFSWRSIDVPLPTSILDPWSTKGIPATTQIRIDLRSHESRLLRLSFQ